MTHIFESGAFKCCIWGIQVLEMGQFSYDRHQPPDVPETRMARGITEQDVHTAADDIVTLGERPTVERIRAHLGTGSPTP